MNVDSILTKIDLFKELTLDSGLKRDCDDFSSSIQQAQNRNLVFMKDIAQKVLNHFERLKNHGLQEELSIVLTVEPPYTEIDVSGEIEDMNSDGEITADQYYSRLQNLLTQISNRVSANQLELEDVEEMFSKYSDRDKRTTSSTNDMLISLVFKDLKTTSSLKEFSKVLRRWNTTLVMYHTLLKSESPGEIELVEVQNGSIDVIFNVDMDIALDLTEVVKIAFYTFAAYLTYKSKVAKDIVSSYLGNKKLIETEKEREQLMLDNIKESVKNKITEQHKEKLSSDSSIDKSGVKKKVEAISKVITDHIVKGNDVKLLNPPKNEDEENPDETKDPSSELRTESAKVKERLKLISEEEQQKLLDTYIINEDEDELENDSK